MKLFICFLSLVLASSPTNNSSAEKVHDDSGSSKEEKPSSRFIKSKKSRVKIISSKLTTALYICLGKFSTIFDVVTHVSLKVSDS